MSLFVIIKFWSLTLFTLGIGVLAFVKGGPAERSGAVLILAIVVLGRVIGAFLPEEAIPILRLVEDGLTALGLLAIALRYASLWLGGAMMLYAVLFTLHATYFVLDREPDTIFTTINNFAFLSVSVCLGVGTAMAWRQRIKDRAAAS